MVIGVLTPFRLIFLSCFFLLLIFFTFWRPKNFLWRLTGGNGLSMIFLEFIVSKPTWFSTYTRFQFLLPSSLYYFYLLESLESAWWLWSVDISLCAPQIIESPTFPNIPEISCSRRASDDPPLNRISDRQLA